MCGMFGLFNAYSPCLEPLSIQAATASSITHRGSYASDVWYDESASISLGHVRLSILELSEAGAQPMHSVCGRFVISINGEIYNHLALRNHLKIECHEFAWRGHSTMETLLACFSVWGVEKTLQAAVGMFAIFLWDKEERILTLARDRLGEKPLFWGWCEDTLLFSSELKTLKALPAFNAQIDRNALALLLRHNCIPAPYSIYQGIEKLEPGHYVQIKKGQKRSDVEVKKYWSLNAAVEEGITQPFTGTDVQAVDLLEQTLNKAVKGQMQTDKLLGAFLSGGVDSSTIAALMQQQSSQPIRTFAIGFDEPGYNEAVYAKKVANHLGAEHTELYVTAQDALELIPLLPDVYCEPFADSSQLPTYLVSKMAKQDVDIVLSGDGGDELFGGYNTYQFAPKIWSKLKLLPLPLRKLAAQLLSGLPMPDKLAKLLSVFPARTREDFYLLLISHWQYPEQIVIGAKSLPTLISSAENWPLTDNFEHWIMAVDAGQSMIDDVLVKVERAATANALEVRIPMLDHRVVELAWQLPLNMKIRDGVGKWPLREVLYRHVPRELIERPKKGFSIPVAQWLRGALREWAEALLDEHRLVEEGYFHPKPIRKAWQEHLSGKRDNSSKLWGVLMFQAWLEKQ